MKKGSGIFSLAVIVLFFISAIGLRIWQQFLPTATLELAGESLYVQVAKIPPHQFKGLGGRDSLEPYDGMLFVHPIADTYGMVMRDMRFPLDIVWLYGNEIVDIAPNVPIEPGVPEEALRIYRPRVPATSVLELPAGWVEERGVQIGDTLEEVAT